MRNSLINAEEKIRILQLHSNMGYNTGVINENWLRNLLFKTSRRTGRLKLDPIIARRINTSLNTGDLKHLKSTYPTPKKVIKAFNSLSFDDQLIVFKILAESIDPKKTSNLIFRYVNTKKFQTNSQTISFKRFNSKLKKLGYSDEMIEYFSKYIEQGKIPFKRNIIKRSLDVVLAPVMKKYGHIFKKYKIYHYWKDASKIGMSPSIFVAMWKRDVKMIFKWLQSGSTRGFSGLREIYKQNKLPVLILTLGREVAFRWVMLSGTITIIRSILYFPSRPDDMGIVDFYDEIVNAVVKKGAYAADVRWIYPPYYFVKYISPIIYHYVRNDEEKMNAAIERIISFLVDGLENEIKQSKLNLMKSAGILSSRIKEDEDGLFYLGHSDYRITYSDNDEMWIVHYPDGRMFNIKDVAKWEIERQKNKYKKQ